MIDFEESMRLLNSLEVKPKKVQKLFLTQALNHFLAQDVIATSNNPSAPTAAMDGYAIKAKDQIKKRLKVVSQTPAGSEVKLSLKDGEAIKTFTGSLMPQGADTLIPIENVEEVGEEIIIKQEVEKGFSVRPVGENFKKGELLIPKGSKVGFAEVGVMASLNLVSPKLFQKPKVAILSTGSEVLEIGEEQTNLAQIRSSNNYTLEALASLHNAEPIQLGTVKDDIESITLAIQEALDSADIVVTTGGVSVGDFDFVKEVVEKRIGATLIFKGVKIKPGQHTLVAKKGDKFLLGLPGFAYSSTITFLLYALPLIYKLQGSNYQPKFIYATLAQPFKKKSKKQEFTPAKVKIEDGEFRVYFENREGSSAILTNLLGEDKALVVTSPTEGDKEIGEEVLVWLINQD